MPIEIILNIEDLKMQLRVSTSTS